MATRHTSATITLVITTALLLAASHARAATPPTTFPSAPTSPKELFDPARAHTVEIHLSPDHWRLLQPGAGSKLLRATDKKPATKPTTQHVITDDVALRPGAAADHFAYVRAQLTFDGQPVPDVGLRFKGNLSYSVSSASLRRPMKLDFDRFLPGDRFAGVATLNLNNQAVDPSQAREALSYDLFRALGVPSPRTGFAIVYLTVPGLYDHEYLGLYTLLEEIDDKFLKRHYPHDSGGLLLKPAGMRGLAYFGPDWPAYASRYIPKSAVSTDLARRVIDLAHLIHQADDAIFQSQIASYLDVDEFLRYVVVNAALANFDSFLSTGHNYYLYIDPASRRASFLPWDMNMTFGGYSWVGTDAQIQDLSISHPFPDRNHLIERVLAIPAYRDAYSAHAREFIAGPFSPAAMRTRLASYAPAFIAAADAAHRAGKLDSPATRPATSGRLRQPDLLTYVDNRVRSIAAQLDNRSAGYIPAFHDPDLVPTEWAKAARPAAALIVALDLNGDGCLDDAEIAAHIAHLWRAAGAAQGDTIDRPAFTRGVEQLITPALRHCATPAAWTAWVFRLADANHDNRIDTTELMTAYRRHRTGSDLDHDDLLGGGRELVEALAGTGTP